MRYLAFVIAIVFAAFAARADGPYIVLEAGLVIPEDPGLANVNEPLGPLPDFTWNRNDLDNGFMVGGSGGYEWSDVGGGRLRAGLAGNYRGAMNLDSKFDWGVSKNIGHGYSVGLDLVGGQDADLSAVSGSLIAEYDVTQLAYKGDGFSIFPTFGGGVGISRVSLNDQHFNATATGWISDGEDTYDASVGLTCDGGDDSANNFAWHVQGGVGVDIGASVSIQALYRFVNLGSVDTADEYACGVHFEGEHLGDFAAKVESEEVDLTAHEIVGRLVYRFSL